MLERLLADGRPLGSRDECSHRSSTAISAKLLQSCLRAGLVRAEPMRGARVPMPCLRVPAALACADRSGRPSPTLGSIPRCVARTESLRSPLVPYIAHHQRLVSIVCDWARSCAGRDRRTVPMSTPEEGPRRPFEPFPGGENRWHAFTRTASGLGRDRVFGTQPEPARPLATILPGIDQVRLDWAACQASFSGPGTNGALGPWYFCGATVPHLLAVRHRLVDPASLLVSRHTLRLGIKLRKGDGGDSQ